MSRSQKPRTVRYFPKMKVRGAARRKWVPLLRQWRLLEFKAQEAGRAFGMLGEAGVRASDQMVALRGALELAIQGGLRA